MDSRDRILTKEFRFVLCGLERMLLSRKKVDNDLLRLLTEEALNCTKLARTVKFFIKLFLKQVLYS